MSKTDQELDDLEARLATLAEWLLQQGFEDESWPVCDAKNAIAEMRVKNAALVGALEEIAEEHDTGRHDGLPEPCPAHDADVMFALARTALKDKENTQ